MKAIIPASLQAIHDAWHFTPAVIDGDYLRCSGMIGLRPDFTVPEDPAEQFTLAFENQRELLAEAGCTYADVVELTSYHVGLRAHAEVFMAVPGALVEIRAVARLNVAI